MNDYPHWVVYEKPEHCVAPGCRHKLSPEERLKRSALGLDVTEGPRFAVHDTDLCNWHHTQFPRVLTDLVEHWSLLEKALYRPSTGQANTAVQTSGVSDISQSWNPHVTEVMADVADWTGFLVRTVLRERPVPMPSIIEGAAGRTYIEHSHGLSQRTPVKLQLAALARHHARWLSGYPTLGPALLMDALSYRYQVLQALGADPVRRVGIKGAVCGHVVDQLGDRDLTCPAPMVAILTPDDRPSLMVCSIHPKTHRQYTATEFMDWAG
jgi:hypothetical protein